jgi:hypothetical protein
MCARLRAGVQGLPSAAVETLLSDPRLSIGVTYLDGDVMSDKVRRVVHRAKRLVVAYSVPLTLLI